MKTRQGLLIAVEGSCFQFSVYRGWMPSRRCGIAPVRSALSGSPAWWRTANLHQINNPRPRNRHACSNWCCHGPKRAMFKVEFDFTRRRPNLFLTRPLARSGELTELQNILWIVTNLIHEHFWKPFERECQTMLKRKLVEYGDSADLHAPKRHVGFQLPRHVELLISP